MFFLSPWLLQSKNLKPKTYLNVFIILLCILSTLCLVGHLLINLTNLFFIDLSSKKPLEFTLRQIGFLYFKGLRPKKLIFDDDDEIIQDDIAATLKLEEINRHLIIVYIRSVLKTSPIFSLIVLYFAATLRPSLPGSLYFLMFIIAGTYWALYHQLHRGMFYPLIFMVVALMIHITSIFAYQLSVLQSSDKTDTIWTRIMGMEILLRLYEENKNGQIMELNTKLNLDSYLNPIALMLAYFASTLSLINRSQYDLTFNTIRMNLELKPHGASVLMTCISLERCREIEGGSSPPDPLAGIDVPVADKSQPLS
uniref:Uncharacterized protein LOC108049718 n=1 Tax=Drosophila rhopaloa TaxID=1041015 RepID=A0A6P4F8A0_DRORH